MGKSKKKKTINTHVAVNKRATFDYKLGEELSCGLVLTGPEVRLIRDNHVQLKGSFVTIRENELWLNNLTLGSETARNIKLLATKRQIAELARGKKDGYTIVPVKLFGGSRHIKLTIALAEGKKKYDKRAAIKRKDLDMEHRRRME